MIRQTPAGLDAQNWSAVRPQREIGNTTKIEGDPAATRRINVGKLSPRNIHEFKNDRAGQFAASRMVNSFLVYCWVRSRAAAVRRLDSAARCPYQFSQLAEELLPARPGVVARFFVFWRARG